MNWFIPALVNSGARGWCGIRPAGRHRGVAALDEELREGAAKFGWHP